MAHNFFFNLQIASSIWLHLHTLAWCVYKLAKGWQEDTTPQHLLQRACERADRLAVDMEIERETLGNERDKKLEGSDNPIKVTCLSAPMYHFNFEF